jgi:hypothetical protein
MLPIVFHTRFHYFQWQKDNRCLSVVALHDTQRFKTLMDKEPHPPMQAAAEIIFCQHRNKLERPTLLTFRASPDIENTQNE